MDLTNADGVDKLVFESLIVAMLCNLQKLDPSTRIVVSQVLEDAIQSVEMSPLGKNGKMGPLSAIRKIERIRSLVFGIPEHAPRRMPLIAFH